MKLKGTKTEKNLLEALAGESQARVKYEWFASAAKKDGFEQIAAIFLESSANEKEHAKLWYKALHDGKIGDTTQNLLAAIAGEHAEHTEMYKSFATTAREEGFPDLATKFDQVAAIESAHEARFQKLLDNIKEQKVFTSETPTIWHCRNCGHLHTGDQAPTTCPTCNHPQSYFERQPQNY